MSDDSSDKPASKKHATGNIGHRSRLRRRFLKNNGQSMDDYEMLELLLMLAQPRRDMKPIAKALLKEYGSFAHCIQADPISLAAQTGCGESVIGALKLAQASALRLLRQEAFASDNIFSGWDQVMDYAYALLAREKSEQLRGLFLDRKLRLISDELLHQGTVSQAPFYPREIIKRLLDLGASSLVLVHNHPSGNPNPSNSDIEATRRLKTALAILEIDLHDHVIVSHNTYVSMRSKNLI